MIPRRKNFIRPGFQVRFMLAFLGTAAVYVLAFSILTDWTFTSIATQLPHDGELLLGHMSHTLPRNLLIVMALLVPVALAVGVMTSFRIAGPLHRFEVYLRALADGKRPAPCRIRKEDELQEFCELLNRATAPLRERRTESEDEAEERRSQAA